MVVFRLNIIMDNPFHKGEREVQHRVGEERQANSNGRIVTNTIIKGAINFIEKQPMLIVSSVDEHKNVWASLLIGDYGIATVPTPNTLSIDINKVRSNNEDIFFSNISESSAVGILFIELDKRRRFRINGTASTGNNQILVSILESYPNCPKYIQQRALSQPDSFQSISSHKTEGNVLTQVLKHWILSADTLFVGSQSSQGQMDVSHRGGNSGFVEIIDESILKIPDYKGNSMYNTLGNFIQNPKAGLLFIDFDNKKVLQLTGTAEILFDQNASEDLNKTTGTGRYWTFKVSRWIMTEDHHNVNWEFLNYSPFNPNK